MFPDSVVTATIEGRGYEALRHGHESDIARTLFGSGASLGESVLINGADVAFDKDRLQTIRIGREEYGVDGTAWLGGTGTVLKIMLGEMIVR